MKNYTTISVIREVQQYTTSQLWIAKIRKADNSRETGIPMHWWLAQSDTAILENFQ